MDGGSVNFLLCDRNSLKGVGIELRIDGTVTYANASTGLWDQLVGNSVAEGNWSVDDSELKLVFKNCDDRQNELINELGFQTEFPDNRPIGELHVTLKIKQVFPRELKLATGDSLLEASRYNEWMGFD